MPANPAFENASHRRSELPPSWPISLEPAILATLSQPTPLLVCDLGVVRDRYHSLLERIPDARCFYAVKCNSSPEILRALAVVGSGFEIASAGELAQLRAIGVDPAGVLYSNPMKPPRHIAEAHAAGVWRFAADSECELEKLATHAPGSAVYVRLAVDDSASVFPLSRKFGADPATAEDLLILAARLGLRPYGITFHVGSQCASPRAWRRAIGQAGLLMARLHNHGIVIEMLDMGGGFPARYVDPVPSLDEITDAITPSLDTLLPYTPRLLAVEPGRYLVAESAVMVASVLGRERRGEENWIYLDIGAYNGLMESKQVDGGWEFPLWTSCPNHASGPTLPFVVSGPSCDSSDTMFFGAQLPAGIDVDDKVYIGSAGGYTLSYASNFNGFEMPTPIFLEGEVGSKHGESAHDGPSVIPLRRSGRAA